MMTLSYNVGLTIGSLIGYIFDHMLGEQLTDTSVICPVYPFAPQRPTMTSVISTTSSTILSTFISNSGNANVTTVPAIVDTVTSTIVAVITSTATASSYSFDSTTINDESYNTLTELELLSTTSP